jgi:hypothetical protein
MIVRNGSRSMFSSLNMPGMTSQSAFRHDRHMGPWMIVGKWPIVEDLQSLRRGLNISVSLTNGLPRAYGDTSPSQMNGLRCSASACLRADRYAKAPRSAGKSKSGSQGRQSEANRRIKAKGTLRGSFSPAHDSPIASRIAPYQSLEAPSHEWRFRSGSTLGVNEYIELARLAGRDLSYPDPYPLRCDEDGHRMRREIGLKANVPQTGQEMARDIVSRCAACWKILERVRILVDLDLIGKVQRR